MTASQNTQTKEIKSSPEGFTLGIRQAYGLNKAIYQHTEAKGFELDEIVMTQENANDVCAQVFYRKPGSNPEDYHCTFITVGLFGWVKSVVKAY